MMKQHDRIASQSTRYVNNIKSWLGGWVELDSGMTVVTKMYSNTCFLVSLLDGGKKRSFW